MKKYLTILLVLVTSSLASLSLLASDSMRCEGRLILRNDHVSKLERFCGEPESYVTSTSYRTISRWNYRYQTHFYEEVEVIHEEFVFNLGPNKFMRLVKVENGIVKKVETLGYGFID